MMILNAFSLNMVKNFPSQIMVNEISLDEVRRELSEKIESGIGHADTATVISSVIGMNIPMNRTTIQMERNSVAIVAQYIGNRLPEGATKLPEGASIKFFKVLVD